MKKFYSTLAISFFGYLIGATQIVAQNTHVYVSAHPDDWSLFMNPNAYQSIKGLNDKVIFVFTTAGDAGVGTGNNNYYLSREEGSLRAIRFMSNAFTSGTGLGANVAPTKLVVNGHSIQKFTYRNAVAYFLRLPDGNVSGNGFPGTNNVSLQLLYNGTVSVMTAIDGSTTYNSINDLRNTIKAIVTSEKFTSGNITFNVADTDNTINPGDHSDHLYSSFIIRDIANSFENSWSNLYQEYNTGSKAINLINHDFLISAGTWGANCSGLSDTFHSSTWNDAHNQWIGKQYYRTINNSSNNTVDNIALNKLTSSSSFEYNNVSLLAVDGNKNTWWGANPYPQWWQVDLKDNYTLNKINVTNYFDGSRYYKYDIQSSLDGTNWTPLVNFNDNITVATNAGNTFNINNVKARYLRVNMNFNSTNVGVHIKEFEAYGTLSTPVNLTNLALNKKTSNSSFELTNTSSMAVDGNSSTWWGANPYPQWWQVDLENLYDLSKFVVRNYSDGVRYYKYNIQTSLDGINWNNTVDFNSNTSIATNLGDSFNINPVKARYVRVNMNFNSANVGVHIKEFEAYGLLSKISILENDIVPESKKSILNNYFRNAYPNPVTNSNEIILQLYAPTNQVVNVFIQDIKSVQLLEEEYTLISGMNEIKLKLDKMPKGMIIISTRINNKLESKKILF